MIIDKILGILAIIGALVFVPVWLYVWFDLAREDGQIVQWLSRLLEKNA